MKRLLLVKKELKGNVAGTKILVSVDENGMVTDPYWYSRLQDAKIDDCCELIDEPEVEPIAE